MDLNRFLARIGYEGPVKVDMETLAGIQNRFLLSVPFENLDIHYGSVPILLDEEASYEKIVERGRGGFCYECNSLMALALCKIGFSVEYLSAQILQPAGNKQLDDLHMFLRVTVGGWDYAVDVGNGQSFREPLSEEGRAIAEIPEGYRFQLRPFDHKDHHEGIWRALFMQKKGEVDWNTHYFVFAHEPRDLMYFKESCRFQQTSPHSQFTQKPFASLALPDGRISATPRALKTNKMGVETEVLFKSEDEFLACLKERFNIYPDGPRRNPLA